MAGVDEIRKILPHLSIEELRDVRGTVEMVIEIREENELSVDLPAQSGHMPSPDGPATMASKILQGVEQYQLSQADQCLLAAFYKHEVYGQRVFSSASVHTEVQQHNRPKMQNITSAMKKLVSDELFERRGGDFTLTGGGRQKALTLVQFKLNQFGQPDPTIAPKVIEMELSV